MRSALIIFDDTCSLCTRSIAIVRALDWLQRFDCTGFSRAYENLPELRDAEIDDGVRVRFADGTYTVGIDAVRSIALRTPLGALVGWTLYLPGVHALTARVYRAIAARRMRACRIPVV